MQKITPSLWFDDNAEEAMAFYVSIFRDSEVLNVSRYGEAGPGVEGTVVTTRFALAGLEFIAINGGPEFTINPAVSFWVGCENKQEIDELWASLTDGGTVLMEMDAYPFSERYGWVQDRFGVSWQLSLGTEPQSITPFLMFVGEQHGRAEEAITRYISLFEDSGIGHIMRYGSGEAEPEGTVMHAIFTLAGQPFMAIDSSFAHQFTFTEATSFLITCADQDEVDHFWEKLADGGEHSQCGWLKDAFGVSWQVVPAVLFEMVQDPDPARANRVTKAMLQMTRIDIAGLQRAYEGEAA